MQMVILIAGGMLGLDTAAMATETMLACCTTGDSTLTNRGQQCGTVIAINCATISIISIVTFRYKPKTEVFFLLYFFKAPEAINQMSL